MNTTGWLDFNSLPNTFEGLSTLFKDYITDFQKVEQFYENDYRSLQHLGRQLDRIKARFKYRRDIVEILKDQNQKINNSEAAFANIERLSNDNCAAVVTGQQVGIFGGPLYTIYKAYTAIALAGRLRTLFPDYQFVPIFWLEGDDHDFAEVNNIGLLGQDNSFNRIEYAEQLKEKNLGAVGEVVFNEQIDLFYEQVSRILPHSEFKTSVIDFMKIYYTHGRSFSDAFASFLSYLFREDGLLFLSASDPRAKKLLSPIFITELTDYPKVSQLIIERSAELENKYHAQIKTKALNLFYFHKGGRYFLEPRENDFNLKGTRHFVQKEEMFKIAHEQPELLSPNVALRPICQDTLLPTIAYVAGPSEIAYFAQLKKVYQYFGLTMPVIYPRASVTLVEEKVDRLLEKYQLELQEFFGGVEKVHAKVIDQVSEVNIDEMFKEAGQRIHDLIKEMHFGVNYIDPTLIGSLENMSGKFQQQLDILKEKIFEAQQRKHEVTLRQIAKITNIILPNNNFQERELNILHFLNKHGLDFPNSLFKEIPIDQFKHQIIRI
jgi:bacillithiol biosynthesis cysteine-adding enzyme BshC